MRNRQFSFNATPMIKARRTKFNTLSHGLKTSMNVGTLYPIYIEEVIPGDTFKVKENHVTRLTSAYIKPPMDNIYQDTYFFFCPSRLYYDRWNEIFGENPNGHWANREEVKAPGIGDCDTPSSIVTGSVADYMTLPLCSDVDLRGQDKQISLLPFRAFADIWNYYFRDENVTDPVHINKGEAINSERFNALPWSPNNYTGLLPKVSKFHDYFTSCLPSPQKGDPVELSLASGFVHLNTTDSVNVDPWDNVLLFDTNTTVTDTNASPLALKRTNGVAEAFQAPTGSFGSSGYKLIGSNLGIDFDTLNSVSVNDLRYAFQLQKMLEKDARGGTRLQEYILSHFGVSTPDMRMQVPEFLGGRRCPLSTQQVAQTFENSADDLYLGSVGAYSLSNGDSRFAKGFTEHGYIIGVSCLRYHHTYQQGIDKMFSRRGKLDFYDPLFANIGEQPVYTTELYNSEQGIQSLDSSVFGYQEAWADMRFRANKITGQMRTGLINTLDVWHFGDFYGSMPYLSESFIEETPLFVDRTIAVESDAQDQFIVDFWFDVEAVREMPLYSIPGLVDHH